MTPDELASVTLKHLQALRADMGELKARMTGVEVQLSAMGQQLAGLTTAVYSGSNRSVPPLPKGGEGGFWPRRSFEIPPAPLFKGRR